MKLYPAIDILEGKAVRLAKGDFKAKKVYDEDPLVAARRWVASGARQLHVVDLDGARTGEPVNLDELERIAGNLGVPVQFGGGLRSLKAIETALESGADRVILGTAAFTSPTLLERALAHWPERVLVAVDVRGGLVSTAGWTETVESGPKDAIAVLADRGARDLVYTNVDRDGMLKGPSLKEIADVATAVSGSFAYSGGIGKLADLEKLARLKLPNLASVVVGKALYERRFTVSEALAALAGTRA